LRMVTEVGCSLKNARTNMISMAENRMKMLRIFTR
jgi:hypothetical protein